MNQRTHSAIAGALFFLGTGCGSESGDPAGSSGAAGAGGSAGASGMSGGAGGATRGGGGSGGAAATGSSGGGGSSGAATGGSSGGGGARVGGAAGASGGDGSAGAAGSLGGGGSSGAGGNDAGTSEGGDGASRTNDGAPDGGASDARDGASFVDDGGSSNLFPCLPPGEEKLIVDVAGTPPLSIMTPSGISCLSRYLPEGNGSDALFDLQWSAASASLFVVVRSSQVVPGQLGTFTPFSILLATGAEAWTSLGDQCRVTLTTSAKIGEMPRGGGTVEDIYKVVGSMTCSAGWAAPAKPGADLRRFEFATRATFLRTP